ncbi:MAG: hypothetical protein FJX76_22240 [Armatimonadetes bacterium]|nr:hypothetical protein [Armatimonadota bacterium]
MLCDLEQRAENQAGAAPQTVGQHPGGNFHQEQRGVAQREQQGDGGHRQAFGLDQPENVNTMGDAFHGENGVPGIDLEIAVHGSGLLY